VEWFGPETSIAPIDFVMFFQISLRAWKFLPRPRCGAENLFGVEAGITI
jgi:hypothetical protein